MGSVGIIVALSALILMVLFGRAMYVMWREQDQGKLRGSEPGSGHHVIHAEYSSGLGGHSTSYKIPRDPKEYEQLFVPKAMRDSNR